MAGLYRLTAVRVRSLKESGLHGDGGGLYLQISPAGARSWIFRFKVQGKQKTMGLGAYPAVPLEEARRKADALRAERATGVDPLKARREARQQAAQAQRRGITFQAYADQYIAQREAEWRNPKHRQQWSNTLKMYAFPILGDLPLDAIGVDHVLDVLRPIWTTKTETATRVRGRIESILDAAAVQGLRSGENPALWRGRLSHLLPRPSKVRRVEHHAAMPIDDVPAFYALLVATPGDSAEALRLTILTACRTSEMLLATWGEIDLGRGVWTIPSLRMKAGVEHRVPLADPARELLQNRGAGDPDGFVFPGRKAGRPLSNMVLEMQMRRSGARQFTPHGFRSTFRDWASERTDYAREVAESALAHMIESKTERAYRRGDLLVRRRAMMADWAAFVTSRIITPGSSASFGR
jgi:integrase